ncbi:glycosyltransferase [Rhodopirellula europaea]|uniref:Glycosyltransferase n=1 Tax=Rhodopirellula europaea 6C TaxID=1263867 RepID=M2A813_9BACT|nr:glycosyltransferase [Rhodopirellula europaea]EMB17751.1 glycosyltransferase [Rhodopirellula europaea 6C]
MPNSLPLVQQNTYKSERPKVSVCCITYNHRKFIEQCIAGILTQETDFRVEILIHDDASTDGTSQIVRRYAEQYPHLIKCICQEVNQYSKGERAFPRLIAQSKGDYIAFCEGDDFWNCSRKLQDQAKFLAENQEYAICFHDTDMVDEDGKLISGSLLDRAVAETPVYTAEDIIGGKQIPTLSAMFVNRPIRFVRQYFSITNEDNYIFSMLSEYGNAYKIEGNRGSYRRHGGGVWSSMPQCQQRLAAMASKRAITIGISSQYRSFAAFRYGRHAARTFLFSLALLEIKPAAKSLLHYLESLVLCLFYSLHYHKGPIAGMARFASLLIPPARLLSRSSK